MKISKIVKSKKLLALALAGIVGFGSVAPAFAAGTETEQTGSTTLKVTTQAVTINMTVPTDMTMVFNADGSNTIPAFNITNNNAYSNVTLEKAAFTGQGQWKMAGQNATLALDEKAMKLKLGAEGSEVAAIPTGGADAKHANATATLAQTFVIPKSQSKGLSFKVTRPDYSTGFTADDAFNVDFTFDLESVSAAK